MRRWGPPRPFAMWVMPTSRDMRLLQIHTYDTSIVHACTVWCNHLNYVDIA